MRLRQEIPLISRTLHPCQNKALRGAAERHSKDGHSGEEISREGWWRSLEEHLAGVCLEIGFENIKIDWWKLFRTGAHAIPHKTVIHLQRNYRVFQQFGQAAAGDQTDPQILTRFGFDGVLGQCGRVHQWEDVWLLCDFCQIGQRVLLGARRRDLSKLFQQEIGGSAVSLKFR